MRITKFATSFLIFISVTSAYALPTIKVARPPQFVAFAFDGSYENARWDATRSFADQLNRAGIPFHFTYFMSGVYFLESQRAQMYAGPHHNPGASDIGFGGSGAGITVRVKEFNQAALEGHEIASHLNGHFDGTTWTAEDWNQEFSTFNTLIFHVFKNNELEGADQKWSVTPQDIQGFRAPYLAVSKGLWTSLRDNHFRYDTSDVQASNYWPDHHKGFWNFALASLRIAGSGKRTLSMDYNFYVAQSGAKENKSESALYEKQMYETYLNYFMSNYNGNRAPINIGHHFPLFNAGAYWRALQSFAKAVCGLPEVKCVTYKELADFMDKTDEATRAAYQQANFDKIPPVILKTELRAPTINLVERLSEVEIHALKGDLPEAHQHED